MDSGFGYRDRDMQEQASINVDTKLVGKQIEVLRKYFDENGEALDVWVKGEVIAIPVMKENNQQQKINGQQKKVTRTKKENHWEIVMCYEEYMDEGDVNPTKQNLLKSMCNKHVEGTWIFVLQ